MKILSRKSAAMLGLGAMLLFAGCAGSDRDKDGIPNGADLCAEEAEDVDGFEDNDGCPDPDNDKDGVCDPWVAEKGLSAKYKSVCSGSDKCIDVPEDKDGFEDEDGCPEEDIGKMAEFIDDGIPVYLYTGNHDVWMFGYFQEEIGATVYTKETTLTLDGKNFYVAHGDGLGDPSLTFRFMRGFFRNKFCQFLYKWIHPDLTMPFGRAWSKSNRKKKRGNAAESYLGEEKEFLVQFAKKHSQTNDIDFYVFGHRHIVLDLTIEGNKRVIILGDWITNFTYAEWDGEHFEIKRYEEKR